jgi:small ligand-binding sensory domain FIST
MRWHAAISSRRSFGQDVEAACQGLADRFAGVDPDLVVVFLSHHHAAHLRTSMAYLLRRFPKAVLVGTTGAGVVGSGQEIEGEPAVAMLGARLPDVEIRPFHVTPAEVQYFASHPGAWRERLRVPESASPSFLVFPEPFTCDGDKLVQSLDAAFPGAPKVGGLASGARHPGQNKLLLDRAVHDRGAIGVLMWGNLRLTPVVARGAMPVGRTHRVTAVQRNIVTRLDDRPALEVLEELIAQLDDRTREAFVNGPVAGVRPGGADGYVMRNVVGIDRKLGGVGLASAAQVGDALAFHERNGDAARRELDGLLGRLPAAYGAVLITCVGRGARFFGVPHPDASALRAKYPALEAAGFVANGEIGPVGARTWLHGFTSVLGLFTPA